MGGSGIAGEVLAAVCGPGCAAQVIALHDYQLPGWVGAADLVLAVSCSGAAEETLAVAAEAARRGCPHGGGRRRRLPARRGGRARPGPVHPDRVGPGVLRASLWGLSVPLLVIAERLGLAEVTAAGFESAAATLERVSYLCRPDSESFVNPAKTSPWTWTGTLPMIWGTSPLAGVAASRFAAQLSENAKYPAVHGVLPEAQPQPGGGVRRPVRAVAGQRPGRTGRRGPAAAAGAPAPGHPGRQPGTSAGGAQAQGVGRAGRAARYRGHRDSPPRETSRWTGWPAWCS